jgi:hypothetical protein
MVVESCSFVSSDKNNGIYATWQEGCEFWSKFFTMTEQVDADLKILELEVYYDTAAFLGGLTKGPKAEGYTSYQKGVEGCPYLNHGRLK